MPNMIKLSDIKCFLLYVTKHNIYKGQLIKLILYHWAQGVETVWQRNVMFSTLHSILL